MVLVHTWNGARGMTYLLNLNLLIETILINVFAKYKYNNNNNEALQSKDFVLLSMVFQNKLTIELIRCEIIKC